MDQTEAVRTVRIVVDSSGARSGGAEVEGVLKSIDDKVASLSDNFGTLFEGLLAKFSFDAIKGQIDKLTEAFDRLKATSDTLGVSTDWMQAFEFAAASSSVKIDVANDALKRFSKTVGEASLGNAQAIQTLNDMGVKILDAQGKVRPLSDTFVDAATKLSGMTDAQKQNALAMQSMGKSAQQVVPMLATVAQGSQAMIDAAQSAGAIASGQAVQVWEDLATRTDRLMLQWRAFAGENFAESVKKGFDFIAGAIQNALGLLGGFVDLLKTLKGMSNSGGANDIANATAASNIRSNFLVPFQAKAAQAQSVYDTGLSHLNTARQNYATNPSPANAAEVERLEKWKTGADAVMAGNQTSLDAVTNKIINASTYYTNEAPPPVTAADFGVTPKPPAPPTTGVSNPPDRTAGQSLQRRIDTLTANANIDLKGATDIAKAANDGALAVSNLEIHTKDLKEVTDAYIKSGITNKDQIDKTTAALDKLNQATQVQKNLATFTLQTKDLQEQNSETQLQLALQGQTTEEIGRQQAQKKLLYDLDKQGILQLAAGNDEAAAGARQQIQDRQAAIDKQYALKTAIDDTAKSQQIWLAPFSSALNDIQNGFEGFFENILKGGTNLWQSLADTMKNVFIKLFAELAVIAVVRPVLAPIVQSVFSPGAAQQLGYGPGTSAYGGLSSIFGPGGGVAPGIQGGGGAAGSAGLSGGSGWFGGISNWLSSPIFPDIGGAANAAGGAVSPSDYNFADLSGAYGGLGSNPAPTGSWLGGISWGQGIGAAAGAGLGIYNLATSHSAAQTIGGIGSLIGAGVSLIPGVGQIAGPLIGLASAFLPSLFGGGPQIPPMPGLNYSFNQTPTNSVLGLIAAAGGTPITSQLYTGGVGQGTTHTWNGQQWVGQDYTEATITSPEGVSSRVGGGQGVSAQQAADQVIAAMFSADVISGAVKNASDTLKKIFSSASIGTTQAAQDAVTFANAYDKLDKAANPVKDSLDALNVQFATLTQQAENYGLSLDPINAELTKETKRTAQDFIDNMLNPLAVQMRALDDAQQSALASAQYINDNVTGVYADINQIVDYYGKQRLALEDQYYQGGITNLQNAIQRLTFGDLANASPTLALAGVKASYTAGLAQAQTGDVSAVANLANLAISYAQAQQQYSGSGPEYAAVQAQIISQLSDVQARLDQAAGVNGTSGTPLPAATGTSNDNARQIAQLTSLVQQLSTKLDSATDQLSQATAQLKRTNVANGR